MSAAENSTPSIGDLETAMRVLRWLSEHSEDGELRDDIARVRYVLGDRIDELEQAAIHRAVSSKETSR